MMTECSLKELPSQPNLRTKAVRPIDLCFFARRHNLLCDTSVKAEQTNAPSAVEWNLNCACSACTTRPERWFIFLVFQKLHQQSVPMVFGPATIAPDGFSMVKRSNALQWSMHHSPYSVTKVELIVVLSFDLFELWPR